jgi:hypothetical protein
MVDKANRKANLHTLTRQRVPRAELEPAGRKNPSVASSLEELLYAIDGNRIVDP